MKQERDYFMEEIERAFQPRKSGDGTAFKPNRWTLVLVILTGVLMGALALPFYFGGATPDPNYVDGLFVSTQHVA